MEKKKDMKFRNWCFTIFCEGYLPPDKKPEGVKYMIYQQERCPETGKLHFQGYIELTTPMRMCAVKELLNSNNAHLEKRKGSQEDAIKYCSKQESKVKGPWTLGVPAVQGQRTDLSAFQNLEFMKMSDWVIENNELAAKYPGGTKLIKACYDQKNYSNKPREINVTAIIGTPGSGKTRFIYDNNSWDNIYKLNTNTNGTLWFDGYEGQEILLIDDFKGWIKYTELLTILDRYPYRCQLKGSYTYANWKTVYITSNYEVEKWYLDDHNKQALKRRINNIINLNRDEVAGNTRTATQIC
nr:MAG: replication associated protein [Cressdnaviricota sp.]